MRESGDDGGPYEAFPVDVHIPLWLLLTQSTAHDLDCLAKMLIQRKTARARRGLQNITLKTITTHTSIAPNAEPTIHLSCIPNIL